MIISDFTGDLETKIKTIAQVQDSTIALYSQEDLLNVKTKLGFPAVGVVYLGLQAKQDTSKTGGISEMVCDIYIIGGELSTDVRGKGELELSTGIILDEIRKVIFDTNNSSSRKWSFVSEVPADLDGSMLMYVQRWKTSVFVG